MRYKKIMIILAVTIFLLGIASVCASDVNDTAIASEDTDQIELSLDNEITEDNLKTNEDNNILAQPTGAVSAHEDEGGEVSSSSEFVIDDSNFHTYFNTDGKILENSNISNGDTIKLGTVSNKDFVIDKELTITSNSPGDVLTNVSFYFIRGSDESKVTGLTITGTDIEKTAISIRSAEDIIISDNIINIAGIQNSCDFYAIYAYDAEDLDVRNNTITYDGKSNGTAKTSAIAVSKSEGIIISDNQINAGLVSTHIDWIEIPPGSYNYIPFAQSEVISLNDCESPELYNNYIDVKYSNFTGDYDSIYVVELFGCKDAEIEKNIINGTGYSYIYGIVIRGEDFTISNNEIMMISDVYATGIEIYDDSTGIVKDNNILVFSPYVAYGIAVEMNWGTFEYPDVDYYNNYIEADSHAAYAMRLYGADSIIDGNKIVARGNYTMGIFSMMMEDIAVITNNEITVEGLKNDTANVGDMIPAQTVGILTMSESKIKNNVINSTGNYSIANTDSGSIITDNCLYASELFGDDSVNDDSGEADVKNNIPIKDAGNYNVTNDTFFIFFTEKGVLREGINPETLTFIGEFSEKTLYNEIDRPITLMGDNAILHDMSFRITSDNVVINGFTFIAEGISEIITVDGVDNVSVINSNFDVAGSDIDNNYVIRIIGGENVLVTGNTINYAVNAGGEVYMNWIVSAENSNHLIIASNKINASMPSYATDWAMGIVYCEAIHIGECDNATMHNNVINVKSNYQSGPYDTLYAAEIRGSDVCVAENEINVIDAPYGYALVVSAKDFNINDNQIKVLGHQSYACAIDIEGNSYGSIENNEINAEGDTVYGIYTAVWVGDVKTNIKNNTIIAEGIVAYGMSLSGSEATVENNSMSFNGNFTTGIASTVDNMSIANNTIFALGSDNGTPAGSNPMGIETTGVHIVSGDAVIKANYIEANGKYAVNMEGTGEVTYNILLTPLLTGDLAVHYKKGAGVLVANNTPVMELNKTNLTVNVSEVVLNYGESTTVAVTAEGATGIIAMIDNKPVNVIDNYTIPISGLDAGTHILTVTTIADENHDDATKNVTITVNKLKTELTASAVTTTYNINKDLVITLKDTNGNPLTGVKVTVNLNGAKTYTTDKNGQVKVATKGLAPKTYAAKITFNGNTKYDKSTKDVKVTVKKATPKMTAKKKTFKKSKKVKKYAITLKDNTGKAIKKAKVTLKVKGKTYKAKTNSKGKATFKIGKLNKEGNFKAVIKYKGNKYYKKVTKKSKIRVIVTFKTVSKGSKDKSLVKDIQQALKDHGYYLTYQGRYLKIDGIFHGCTERSVKEFQHDLGLKASGSVDEKTAKKLGII